MQHLSQRSAGRYAIYCGSGVYLSSTSLDKITLLPVIKVGPLACAMVATRSIAVGALHAARRAGLSAWMVRHPARVVTADRAA